MTIANRLNWEYDLKMGYKWKNTLLIFNFYALLEAETFKC